MKIKRIITDVDDSTHQALKVKAAQQGKSISDVVRQLIGAFVGREVKAPTQNKPKQRNKKS